jgi:hypothetical protein
MSRKVEGEESGIGTRSEWFRVSQQLREVHEDNLRRIDDELGSYGCEVKMGVM